MLSELSYESCAILLQTLRCHVFIFNIFENEEFCLFFFVLNILVLSVFLSEPGWYLSQRKSLCWRLQMMLFSMFYFYAFHLLLGCSLSFLFY